MAEILTIGNFREIRAGEHLGEHLASTAAPAAWRANFSGNAHQRQPPQCSPNARQALFPEFRDCQYIGYWAYLLLYQYTLDLCEVLHIKGKILGEGSGRPSQKNSVKATLCAFSPSSTNLVPYLTCQHPPGQIFVMLLGLRSVPELRWSLTLHVSTHWDKS